MEDRILDFFEEEFDQDTRIIAVKYFYFETEARLYAARLKEAQIPSFISNTNVSTALALGEGGIGLHIREEDAAEATRIIAQLDLQKKLDNPEDDSFRDADLEEIRYLEAIHKEDPAKDRTVIAIILMIILFLVLRAFLRGRGGFLDFWRDAF